MNNEIEVGDRVFWHEIGPHDERPRREGVVAALDDGFAWIRYGYCYTTLSVTCLTRVEPELVVLRPKYKVGQDMQSLGGMSRLMIREMLVAYRMNDGSIWCEEELKPVCRECGK